MNDHQVDTINQLREVIKDLQAKLEYRTKLLAAIVPLLFTCNETGWGLVNYAIEELFEHHGASLEQFKEEYAKETGALNDSKGSKL